MNKSEKEKQLDNYVIISYYKTFNWLLSEIIPLIREKYNYNFIFCVPEGDKLPASLEKVKFKSDIIMNYPDFTSYYENDLKSNEVFPLSRSIEEKHNLLYYRDILQQERSFAKVMFAGANQSVIKQNKNLSAIKICNSINNQFSLIEQIFKKYSIKLSIVWPRTSIETVCSYVSSINKIAVTYPYISKGEGNLVYWANGPFADGNYHNELYKSDIDVNDEMNKKKIEPSDRNVLKRSDAKSHYTFSSTIILILKKIYVFLILRIRDVYNLRWNKRVNLLYSIKELIRIYFFHKRFVKLCTPIENLSGDYALFTFQNEPEFSMQGRCKEFNDQISIARSLALSMPAGINLFIKEHSWLGSRDLYAYKELIKLPNVHMLPFYYKASDHIKSAKFVASLNGSVLYEAACEGVPAISFALRSEFFCLENITNVTDLTTLPEVINKICKDISEKERIKWKNSAHRFLGIQRYISFDGTPLFSDTSKSISKSQVNKAFVRLEKFLS